MNLGGNLNVLTKYLRVPRVRATQLTMHQSKIHTFDWRLARAANDENGSGQIGIILFFPFINILTMIVNTERERNINGSNQQSFFFIIL